MLDIHSYKKYVMIDPLGAVTKTRKAIEEEQEEIGAAPMSITQREQMERQGMENYFYVPDLGDVPEIDVPNYLPDLPGITMSRMTPALAELPTCMILSYFVQFLSDNMTLRFFSIK